MINRRCALDENQQHIDELARLLLEQQSRITEYRKDIELYELEVERLEDLCRSHGIDYRAPKEKR